MTEIDPEQLYAAVASHNQEAALQLILQLKAHVKRDKVDLRRTQRYFDCLLLAFHTPKLSISAFSTLCHLVKRVYTQKPAQFALVHARVAPFLFDRMAESRSSVRSAAMKAMVTVWGAIPDEFETDLKRRGLKNSNPIVRARLLDMVAEVASSPGFSLMSLLGTVVELLGDNEEPVVKSAYNLVALYFSGPAQNDLKARTELVSLLTARHIGHTLSIKLLSQLPEGKQLVSLYKRRMTGGNSRPATIRASSSMAMSLADRPRSRSRSRSRKLSGPRPISELASRPPSARSSMNTQPTTTTTATMSSSDKIDAILETMPGFAYVDNLTPADFDDSTQLLDLLSQYEVIFEGKESEHNWKKRYECVKTLQAVLRGNAVTDFPEALGQIFHGLKGCLSKAAMSLRTALSNAGCQLCKELAMFLGAYLDGPTIDTLLSSLLKLTYSRKTISHQRANLSIVSLVLYCSASPRMLLQMQNAFNDKNVQPRVYVATWVELFLLKYSSSHQLMGSSREYIDGIISRGVGDPTPAVREACRAAFWTLNEVFPRNAQEILSVLPPTTVRALQRSQYTRPLRRGHSRGVSLSYLDIVRAARRQGGARDTSMKEDSREEVQVQSADVSLEDLLGPLNGPRAQKAVPVAQVQHPRKMQLPQDVQKKESTVAEEVSEVSREDKDKDMPPVPQKMAPSPVAGSPVIAVSVAGSPVTDSPVVPVSVTDPPVPTPPVADSSVVPPAVTAPATIPPATTPPAKSNLEGYTEKIKKENAVYDQIVSSDPVAQQAGVAAILDSDDDGLPLKFNSALNRLSVTNPQVLMPMFEDERSFKRISSYLSTDNTMRVCCLYSATINTPLTRKELVFILHCVSAEDMYLGLANTLSLCIDSSKIQDLNLSMQFVKYKKEFAESCFDLSMAMLADEGAKIENYLLSSIFEALLKCWDFSDHSGSGKYVTLLGVALKRNADIFKKCVASIPDVVMKTQIAEILHLEEPADTPGSSGIELDEANLDELTMVGRKDIVSSQLSDVETDLTKIMPVVKVEKLENIEDTPASPFLNTEAAVKSEPFDSEMKIKDVFEDKSDKSDNEDSSVDGMDVDSSKTHSSGSMTTPEIERLTLGESEEGLDSRLSEDGAPVSPPKSGEVDTIIKSADPLAPITGSKPSGDFFIYEDKKEAPKEVTDKDMGSMHSWYEFEDYKYRHKSRHTAVDVKTLLAKLDNCTIRADELSSLVHALQDGDVDSASLTASILHFLSPQLDADCIFPCLYLLRGCMAKSHGYRDRELFSKLVEISGRFDGYDCDELYFAVQETLACIPKVSYYVERLRDKNGDALSVPQVTILLETLFTLLDPRNVSYEDVFLLDVLLFQMLKSKRTVVRKMAVMIYAKFYQFKNKAVKSSEGQELVDSSIFKKLDDCQLSLVKHYATMV